MKLFVLLSVLAAPAFSGGWFVISLGSPSAHANPVAREAAFVVRIYGCSAALTKLEATAEGIVDRQRRSVPLTLTPVGSALKMNGTWGHHDFAVPAPSGTNGNWVIKVVAFTGWETKSVLVPVSEGKLVRSGTRFAKAFTDGEISAALME